MKRLTLGLLFLFVATFVSAQISEGAANMSKGSNNALSVMLDGEPKDIEKGWTKYIKDYKGDKTKKDKKTGEIFSDNMVLKDMSTNTVDVYTTIVPKDGGSLMTVWFDLGGAYLSSSSHPEQYAAAEAMLKEFSLTASKKMVEDQLKEEEKKLKDLRGDYKKMEKDIDDYTKEIEKCKKKIAEAESGIEKTEGDKKTKQGEIDDQSKVVDEIKSKLKKMD